MEVHQAESLRQNRLDIVNNLEPRGLILDRLLEDGVLTENDVELVSQAPTRKDRCHLLLSILPTRGPVAYGSFKKALTVGQYDFIAEHLDRSDPVFDQTSASAVQNSIRNGGTECQICKIYYEHLVKENKLRRPNLRTVFNPCFCIFVDNVDPKDVIDHLIQENVISIDDVERIMSSVTRRDRCRLLLEILLCDGELNESRIIKILSVALTKKYSFIAERMSGGGEDNQPVAISLQITDREVKQNKIYSHDSNTIRKDIDVPKYSADDNEPTCLKQVWHDARMHDNNATDIEQCKRVLDDEKTVSEKGTSDVDNNVKEVTKDVNTVDGSLPFYTLDSTVLGVSPDISAGVGDDNTKPTSTSIQKVSNQAHISEMQNGRIASLCDDTIAISDTGSVVQEDENGGKELVLKQMTALQSERPSRRLTAAFNYLSTLINQGNYDKFQSVASKLQLHFSQNYDLMCIIGYLQASRDLFQTNFDSAKSHISSTLALVPKTSNPRYFTLELFTAKTRMYITQKKLVKLERTLDEAMMILETDPVGCSGRAAGWLYINHARTQTAQLSCLNLSKPSAMKSYERLFESAKTSFQRSMTNFKQDGGKDGPFGFGYALCRLVILLLRCGDNGLTMDVLTPTADDVRSAGQYIQHLEDSDIVISSILDMHFRLAKCDYQFRRGNYVRANEHAQIAHELATDLRLLEFTEHAYNRVKNLRSKMSECLNQDEMSEDEYNRILFEESSE